MCVCICFIGLRILSLKTYGGWNCSEQIGYERTSITHSQLNGNKTKKSNEKSILKRKKLSTKIKSRVNKVHCLLVKKSEFNLKVLYTIVLEQSESERTRGTEKSNK